MNYDYSNFYITNKDNKKLATTQIKTIFKQFSNTTIQTNKIC